MNKIIERINGKEIAIYRSGYGQQKIFFLHGNSMASNIWQKQFESDLVDSFELIAMDLPGHGASFWSNCPEIDYEFRNICNLVLQFLQSQKIDKPIFVGNSLGGHILIEISKQIEDLAGLVIFGTPPIRKFEDTSEAFIISEELMLSFKAELSHEDVIALSSLQFGGSPPNFAIENLKNTDGVFRDIISRGSMKNQYEIIKSLGKKAAIFHGENEKTVNKNFIEDLHFNDLWGRGVHIIPNSAHYPQYQNPHCFNELLKNFITSLD